VATATVIKPEHEATRKHLLFTDEHEDLRESMEAWVKKELWPHRNEWEETFDSYWTDPTTTPGGGWFTHGDHPIDLTRWLFGVEFTEVLADMRRRLGHWQHQTGDPFAEVDHVEPPPGVDINLPEQRSAAEPTTHTG